MSEREVILERIRRALETPAPVPGATHDKSPLRSEEYVAGHIREWLPAVGPTFAERLELFRQNAANLQCNFRLAHSMDDLCQKMSVMTCGWQRFAYHRGELTDSVCGQFNLPACQTDGSYDVVELESCDVGITQCDALIAQTGSILLTSHSAGGRALSVLPPHHIVLARQEQLISDLPAAFELLERRYSSDYPSFVSFITGPSRTGDIERTVVLGAHGPRELTVFLLCERNGPPAVSPVHS